MFWVISVYFNIRNTLPKSGTFLLFHPVYDISRLRVKSDYALYRRMQSSKRWEGGESEILRQCSCTQIGETKRGSRMFRVEIFRKSANWLTYKNGGENIENLCFELNFDFKYLNFINYILKLYIYIIFMNYTLKLYFMNSIYTGCPRRNVPDFGRVFLMLKYTNINQNTYVQSWTDTEIMAREVWNFDSCYTLVDYQIHIKTGRNMWFL